jgi:hypothetical protein
MCSSYANSYLITILKTDLESPPTGLHLQIRAKWYKILGAIGPRDVYTTAHVTWADLGVRVGKPRMSSFCFQIEIELWRSRLPYPQQTTKARRRGQVN